MATAPAMTSRVRVSVTKSQSKMRALVVDDSPTILHAICSLLEHQQIVQVIGRAENGAETIKSVAELKPDLVLIDADMPGMSGLRTSLLLSQSAPGIKVVLMSMDTTAQFRRACAGCGAQAVIYKPKFLSELFKLLHPEPVGKWQKPAPRAGKIGRPVSIMR